MTEEQLAEAVTTPARHRLCLDTSLLMGVGLPTIHPEGMTFEEKLDQAVAMLQRRGRVTYRALKAQFQLDDDLLDTLKDELLFSHPVVDEAGRGLVWTGDPASPEPEGQQQPDAESRFHAILPVLTGAPV